MTDLMDDLTGDLMDELVEARLAWTSPLLATWYAEADLRRQLRSGLSVEVERLGDATFGGDFRTGVGIGGPEDPLDWANRRLDLPGGGWAVTGIRFRGGDAVRPFVDVVATTAPPTPDGLAAVADVVVPAYEGFSPRCLRADVPDTPALVEELGADPRFGPHCTVDLHVVAGLVDRLRTHPRTAAYPEVRLRAGDPQALARRVAEIYAELAATEPGLAMWANPEDLESLSECAEEGLLFEVLAEGESAGVVAALRYDAHALTGFSVQELCLDAAHRGRRLAPATVQRLVDELPAGPGDALWGTIHPANVPSLRNALSIGRTLVGGYVWVTPAGLPGMPGTTAG
jgi:L-amino acid N-acyltransferase YncA